jgi:hypothetical protein
LHWTTSNSLSRCDRLGVVQAACVSADVSTSVALTRDPLADELPGGGQNGSLLAVSQGLGVRFGAVESRLEQFGEALCEGERE